MSHFQKQDHGQHEDKAISGVVGGGVGRRKIKGARGLMIGQEAETDVGGFVTGLAVQVSGHPIAVSTVRSKFAFILFVW